MEQVRKPGGKMLKLSSSSSQSLNQSPGTSTDQPGDEQTAAINLLPTLILERIFALTGPEALLTTVSAVCHRWKEVAMSPHLWSRVAVDYVETIDKPWQPETKPSGDVLWLHIADRKRADMLRMVLRRAPCLLRLQCSLRQRPTDTVLETLWAARRVPLEQLAMLRVPKEVAVPLIKAQAGSLRSLEWRQAMFDVCRADENEYMDPSDHPYAPGPIWRLLVSLPLRELVVDWTWTLSALGFTGFAERCRPFWGREAPAETPPPPVFNSQLVKFHLHLTEARDDQLLRWQRDMVFPLLRASAARLQNVRLRLAPVPLSVRKVGLGATSAALHTLTLPAKCRLMPLLECRALRSLTLLGSDVYSPSFDDASDEDDASDNFDAPTDGGKRRSVAFLEACADPERGLPLTTLCLVGFPKYSTPELPGAVSEITSLKDLRFLKCDFRACDNSWWALTQAVPKLTSLERLAVGRASDVPLKGLSRLGAAVPPSLRWLRLDEPHAINECDRLEAEVRGIVAAHPAVHVVLTTPSSPGHGLVCPDRCEELHGASCGARVYANHAATRTGSGTLSAARSRGGRVRRARGRNVGCPDCSPILRYPRSSLTEVTEACLAAQQAAEDPDDPQGDSDDSEASSCCEGHSRRSYW